MKETSLSQKLVAYFRNYGEQEVGGGGNQEARDDCNQECPTLLYERE